MIKIVSFSRRFAQPFSDLPKKSYPLPLDISDFADLRLALEHPAMQLELNSIEVSRMRLLKTASGASSLFVQCCNDDSFAKCVRLTVSSDVKPADVLFLAPDDSRNVITFIEKIDETYLSAGAEIDSPEISLMTRFLNLASGRDLNSIIYSSLHEQEYE